LILSFLKQGVISYEFCYLQLWHKLVVNRSIKFFLLNYSSRILLIQAPLILLTHSFAKTWMCCRQFGNFMAHAEKMIGQTSILVYM